MVRRPERAICTGTALIIWLMFRSAGPIARRLGPIGMNIVTRVMGILVSAPWRGPRRKAAANR